ncbi:hypothetical protein INR49_012032 [Caranx melampygus]|nr:hypothetical protein INR49_012032 [Caranx melampygus]
MKRPAMLLSSSSSAAPEHRCAAAPPEWESSSERVRNSFILWATAGLFIVNVTLEPAEIALQFIQRDKPKQNHEHCGGGVGSHDTMKTSLQVLRCQLLSEWRGMGEEWEEEVGKAVRASAGFQPMGPGVPVGTA